MLIKFGKITFGALIANNDDTKNGTICISGYLKIIIDALRTNLFSRKGTDQILATYISISSNEEILVPRRTFESKELAFFELHEVSCIGKTCSSGETCLGERTGKKFRSRH